jgi:hypothetical protein
MGKHNSKLKPEQLDDLVQHTRCEFAGEIEKKRTPAPPPLMCRGTDPLTPSATPALSTACPVHSHLGRGQALV